MWAARLAHRAGRAVEWDQSSPLIAIKAHAPNATVSFADGTNIPTAAGVAGAAQVAIVFVSEWASEGMDETSIDLRIVDILPLFQWIKAA